MDAMRHDVGNSVTTNGSLWLVPLYKQSLMRVGRPFKKEQKGNLGFAVTKTGQSSDKVSFELLFDLESIVIPDPKVDIPPENARLLEMIQSWSHESTDIDEHEWEEYLGYCEEAAWITLQ